MHVVSNIRNLEKFLSCYPWAAKSDLSKEDLTRYCCSNIVRAHHYDLVVAQVVEVGATVTENREGHERQLALGEWLIAPLIGRESTLGHSSVLPAAGIPVGTVIDYISTGGGLGFSMDNPPNRADPSKVKVVGILHDENGCAAKSQEFGLDLRKAQFLRPVVAVVGSRSDAGKTTVCIEVIKNLRKTGKRIGVGKLSGTAQKMEILELSVHADEGLDTADAGMPTTYPPSQERDERAVFTSEQAIIAAERIIQALSVENDIIVVEFGGDLLSASVPEILQDPLRLNLVAVVMAAESATAAIGMETKLLKISKRYEEVPEYIVGPTANLRANRNRVKRETSCAGCYDLWNKNDATASKKQVEASIADAEQLNQKLLEHCGF